MRITRQSYIKALALWGLLLPAPVLAQANEACGTADQLLMYCTFDDGAKRVSLCQSDGIINYEFGTNFNDPELTLTASFADLDYLPYGWASNTIFESVMLRNGNTTYDVFASIPRGPDAGLAEGGIVVTHPDQSRITLTCDPGSVVPNDPLEGIGQLIALVPGNGHLLLSICLAKQDSPTSCVGAVQRVQMRLSRCAEDQLITDCWAAERDAWDHVLTGAMTTAMDEVAALQGNPFAQKLRTAQDNWEQTRNLDCELAFVLPFAGDGGAAKCRAQYSAERLMFLRDVVSGAEFQG